MGEKALTESVEEAVDWAAIEAAARRPPPPPPPSSSRRLSALLTYVGAIGVYVWIISSSGYLDNTMAAFRAGEVINLRDHLVANHQFPEEGTQVVLQQATLGFKGAEWSRTYGFKFGNVETRYFQIIGAVCPFEMPVEACRRLVVEVPLDHEDAPRFEAIANLDVTGRLYFVESGSRFEPLISFMREHLALDIEGAALVAHGDQPKLGGEFAFFWLIAVLPPIFLTVVLILAGALRRAET